MKLIQYIKSINKQSVYDILKSSKYDDGVNIENGAYDQFIDKCLNMQYNLSNNKIIVKSYLDEDVNEYIVHSSYYYENDLETPYALDFIDWENILDCEVQNECNISDDEVVASIIYEMTFNGFTMKAKKDFESNLIHRTTCIVNEIYDIVAWEDVDNIVDEIASWVETNKYNFDCILSIARGGTVLGTMLSYKLNIPIRYVGLSSYKETERQNDIIFTQYAEIGNYKNILVVDDIIDSGRTVNTIRNIIEMNSCDRQFKYVTIYATENNKTNVDWYKYIKTDKWIAFPWETNNFKHIINKKD